MVVLIGVLTAPLLSRILLRVWEDLPEETSGRIVDAFLDRPRPRT
ncbi:hypothetical protein ACH4LN_17415 [Streptomyces albus]|nr:MULTISPECIES: hypothetical protein [Streptomyces]MDI6407772.1 hypothetical protein [Streptomyces albus]UVN57104.1 hypothetical protein NR995_23265 [Streptomyces albus]GHJ23835.1 hypothetical protein TPA0909_54490 [Streptomyces albus]